MKKIIKKNKAFVLLFTVMLSAIILSIALGVSNIAYKEQRFSTSARDSNDAFFAADVGVECALFYDKTTGANRFIFPDNGTSISCAGQNFTPSSSGNASSWSYSFTITGLGGTGVSCTKVTVAKLNVPPVTTTITSEGLNSGNGSCSPTNTNSVERELKVFY